MHLRYLVPQIYPKIVLFFKKRLLIFHQEQIHFIPLMSSNVVLEIREYVTYPITRRTYMASFWSVIARWSRFSICTLEKEKLDWKCYGCLTKTTITKYRQYHAKNNKFIIIIQKLIVRQILAPTLVPWAPAFPGGPGGP